MTEFPFTTDMSVSYPGPPPGDADVIVIGGGVIGVCTALFLARAGRRVVLLEKGRIAAEQSSRNWGWIRVQGRDPDEIPIVQEANAHWRDLAQQTNVDIGLVQGGVAYIGETEKNMHAYEAWMVHAQEHGLDSRILSAAETADLIPGMSGPVKGAIYTASDMRAEPWVAVPALAAIAAREGATLVENCAVRTLDIEAGRVAGVITEAGRIKAPEVVLAGGAWSSLFLQRHGVRIPQLSVRATVAATEPVQMDYAGGAANRSLAFRQRQDGGLSIAQGGYSELFVGPDAFRALPKYLTQLRSDPLGVQLRPAAPKGYPDAWTTPRSWGDADISPFETTRVLNPSANMRKVATLTKRLERMFPKLAPVRIRKAWAGMIDTMPDIVPVVDRVDTLPGLTIGTGMSGHGFGIGPGMGRILADMAQGNAPGHDLSRFRLSRFHDGSPMVLGPGI